MDGLAGMCCSVRAASTRLDRAAPRVIDAKEQAIPIPHVLPVALRVWLGAGKGWGLIPVLALSQRGACSKSPHCLGSLSAK